MNEIRKIVGIRCPRCSIWWNFSNTKPLGKTDYKFAKLLARKMGWQTRKSEGGMICSSCVMREKGMILI